MVSSIREARAHLERALVLLEQTPAPEGAIRMRLHQLLGDAHLKQGDLALAIAQFEVSLALARQLADQFFYETLVRVHRASEGAPYYPEPSEHPH